MRDVSMYIVHTWAEGVPHLQTGCSVGREKKVVTSECREWVDATGEEPPSQARRWVGAYLAEQRGTEMRRFMHSGANSEMSKRVPTRSMQARRAWRACSGRRSVSTGSTASRKRGPMAASHSPQRRARPQKPLARERLVALATGGGGSGWHGGDSWLCVGEVL